MRPDRLGPAEYAQLLAVRGFKVLRRQGGWQAQCPLHDDCEPSLFISEGRDRRLLLHCFGCQAKFSDLLAAVGVEVSKSPQDVVNRQIEYLRIRSSGDSYLSTTAVNEVFGSISRTATIGIDPTANRTAVEEERFSAGELMVRMPARAGRVMRHVLEDLVAEANGRIEGRHTMPIAYGCDDKARQLGVRRGAITEALKGLERHGVIERVRRLPLLGVEDAGAWTWRLVVTPAVTPVRSRVRFDFAEV